METLNELIESLGNNIKSIEYSTKHELWTIKYYSNLKDDTINTEYLIKFLNTI